MIWLHSCVIRLHINVSFLIADTAIYVAHICLGFDLTGQIDHLEYFVIEWPQSY